MKVSSIEVNDVEELSYAVDPWQIQMRQLSCGKLHAGMHITQLEDIFVSDEYWSKTVLGTGQTPPGYLVLAGPISGTGFTWCGAPISNQRLAYAPDCREVDFLTTDKEHHWTLLIPRKAARGHLGDDILEKLSGNQTSLEADTLLIQQLSSVVLEVLSSIRTNKATSDGGVFEATYRARLITAASQLLLNANGLEFDKVDRNRRLAAYIKAKNFIATINHPISVKELAKYVGVSRRTLEIAFKEATGLSPKTFMQRVRLGAFYRQLRSASKDSTSVTYAAQEFNFTELGRTTGYYRDLFGEYPSFTLGKDPKLSCTRFSEILSNNAL